MFKEIKPFQEYLLKNKKDLKTIEAYCVDINLFLEYVKKPIYDIDDFDVEKYKLFLLENSYKISSINRKMVALNLFMKYSNVTVDIRQEKIHMQNFAENLIESEEFFKIIEQIELNQDYRAKALLYTMYYTGTRISECLSLTINDISKSTVLIKGKGKKYRNIFIPDKLKVIWKEYIPHRINKGNKLFTGRRGAITTRYSNDIFKKYATLANVDLNKAHNHNLRHLYCRSMISRNVDIATLADLVGHG